METNTGGEKLVEERSLLYDKRLFPSASIFDPNNFNRYHFNTNAKRKFADVIAYKLLNRYLPTLDNDFERVWGKCDYSADKGGFFDYSQLKNTDTCIFTGLEFYGSDSLSRNTYEAFGGYEAFNMCLSAMFEQDGNYFGTGETSKYRTGTRAWCYDMKKKLKSITLEYEPETFYFTRDSYETDESYNAAVDKLVDTICEINQLSNEHEIKSDYVQGLKSGVEYLYELSFTNDFLKNNLESMLLPIIESSGEFPVSIFMYASKDIYEYKKIYRKHYSNEERKLADLFIYYFTHPFAEKDEVNMFWCSEMPVDDSGYVILFIKEMENYSDTKYSSTQNANMFFNEAFNFVVNELPKLNSKYK